MIYDVELDEYIMEVLSKCRVNGYTKWDRVLGRGERSAPKMDDSVWPGFNCSIAMAVEENIESEVMSALTEIVQKIGGKGMEVFELPVAR